jgi:protein TonB
MFEQSILANGKNGRRVWTTCAGVTGEALLVGLAAIVPMVFPQALPGLKSIAIAYLPTVPPPPPGPQEKPAVTHAEPRRSDVPRPFTAPPKIPDRVATILDPPEEKDATVGVSGGMNLGSGPGVPGGIDLTRLFAVDRPVPVVRPPEPRPPVPARELEKPIQRIRISAIQPSQLLVAVKPVYPPIAKAAHISGVVELDAVIGVNGRLSEIQVKSGNPLLVPAALDAVKQWVYKPTYLGGDPVEVATTIVVTFILNQ